MVPKIILHPEAVIDEGDQVRLADTARADKQRVGLVRGQHTLPHQFHGALRLAFALDKDPFQ
jgi:hypothetical protein